MIVQVQAGSVNKWLTMLCKLHIATNDMPLKNSKAPKVPILLTLC